MSQRINATDRAYHFENGYKKAKEEERKKVEQFLKWMEDNVLCLTNDKNYEKTIEKFKKVFGVKR